MGACSRERAYGVRKAQHQILNFVALGSVPRGNRPLRDLLGLYAYLHAHPTLTWADLFGVWPIPRWCLDLEIELDHLFAEGRRMKAQLAPPQKDARA